MSPRRRERGFSLVELMVALTIMAILAGVAVPRYQVTLEQAHLNFAASRLRCMATAQRLYFAENKTFAPSLATLVGENLLTSNLAQDSDTFTYIVASADDDGFEVTATRTASVAWSGTISIDQTGVMTGVVTNGVRTLEPPTS